MDYMEWRGDVTFKASEVNEIDGLIFSQMSYVFFEDIIDDNNNTIGALAERFFNKYSMDEIENLPEIIKSSCMIFKKMAECERYKNLRLINYVTDFQPDIAKQFAAVTVVMDEENYYVAYRGTDDSLAGWEEDFKACYMMPILSQMEAVEYLGEIMTLFHGNVYLGGHSKGGNLATYAAVMIDSKYKDRIVRIDNYDGPGFLPEFVESESYKKMCCKVRTYNPQKSIVGMIMFREGENVIVESTGKGFMQHSGITWKVQGRHFVTCDRYEKFSENFADINKTWINEITKEERELAIEIVFKVIRSGFDTVTGLKEGFFSTASTIVRSYKGVDKATRKVIGKIVSKMIRLSSDSISEKRKEKKNIAQIMDNHVKK
jgi:hypothetical protein